MASVEDIKQALKKAESEYDRCVEKLEKFMEGGKGDRLEELKKNLREKEDVDEKQRKKWIEEKEELEEEANDLKVEKKEWKEELLKWAEKLRTATDDTDEESKDTVAGLRSVILQLETGKSKNSSSVYRYMRQNNWVKMWKMENEIQRLPRIGEQTFKKLPSPPTKGSDEVKQHQPFCKKVVDETVKCLSLKDLLVLGDTSYRKEDEVYPDIIIGLNQYYSQLTNNPPDLSKGLGWEVKNDIIDQRKGKTGKGQIVKYASIYLTANVPLTSVFYGCLTDGNHWQFMKVTINEARNKLAMGESQLYIWNTQTASLIAGLINHYYDEYLMKASGEKKDSPNNDKAYMFLKLSLTPESLLASFIKKGFIIKLDSGNDIHVQVISHLGTGKESLVFLVQVLDYGIKEAVLKIEVRKNSEFSQIYQEISALHALSNLSCVPKILFEGHTMGGYQAIITDFVGQPLESWISDNGDINDYTLFQIILDLWSCLKQIHSNCYAHGDVAIRNIIRRNERFYFIDFGLATMLQLRFDSCQAIIQDYIELCQIIAIIKVGRKMSLLELIDKLEGGLKQFVASVEDASRWKITDEEKWLEKFGAEVQQFHKDYHLPENTLEI